LPSRFASEHLNNNTPVNVIQALLGHATMDSVMVHAKLYPQQQPMALSFARLLDTEGQA
jgi:hypothetical protein